MARRAVNEAGADVESDELLEAVMRFKYDPYGFVMFAFEWGVEGTDLANEEGPDDWQREMLQELGRQVRERADNPDMAAILLAASSGHGVGKTALVSWVIIWFCSVHLDIQCVVTANTLGQLSGKTWRELARWHRRAINADWFMWTATTFYLKALPETHKANAVAWSKENSEAFAGTHARNVLMIFDEASAIADAIWEVAEGALTTSGAIWLVFGNPTKNTGRFRECWRKFRHRWTTWKIDSRRAKKANRGQIQAWIEDHGEDSDFVRIRVRGEFPRTSATQLIGTDLVEQAQTEWKRRVPRERIIKALAAGPEEFAKLRLDLSNTAARLLSCDVARYGSDQTVIGWREGKTFLSLAKYRGLSIDQVAYRLMEWMKALQPDATFVDGSGIGGGVCDLVRAGGYEVIEVNGAVKAMNEARYLNRRAEMWWLMREWLAAGGALPHDDPEIMTDLTGPEYTYAGKDRIALETKDDMRARGLSSPDTADALAMTFAVPVAPRQTRPSGRSTEEMWQAFLARGGRGSAPTWRSH